METRWHCLIGRVGQRGFLPPSEKRPYLRLGKRRIDGNWIDTVHTGPTTNRDIDFVSHCVQPELVARWDTIQRQTLGMTCSFAYH